MTTIVTLALDDASQAWFEAQRQAHYPPALNRIPAHLSLFHSLPGDRDAAMQLRGAAAETARFALRVDGVQSMGRGVMYALAAPELMLLHRTLAQAFHPFLTPQDRQPLRPHVVVQNKVEPAEARELLARLRAGFAPREALAQGLDWWEYMGGPWRHLERFPFAGPSAESLG